MEIKSRGYYFSIDVLIAVSIIVLAILLVPYLYIKDQPTSNLQYAATDIASLLSQIKVSEINNSFVKQKIADKNITKSDNTLLEQIGEFWALNKSTLAYNLVQNITFGLIPANLNFGIYADGDEIYRKGQLGAPKMLASSTRLISGIEKSKPVRGQVSRAYLASIGNKKTSAYRTFGGFIGQGNLTVFIDNIPVNATINELDLELSAITNFKLYINNQQCLGTFVSSTQDMVSNEWHINDSSCLGKITPGSKNYFRINFIGSNLSAHYTAGGLVKVIYQTKNIFDAQNFKYNYFPGVVGFINEYSSIYAPGKINYMNASLHLRTNYTVFMTIGDKAIVSKYGTNNTNKTLVLTNANFSSLNYSKISGKTVPLRLGTGNVTGGRGIGDVVLITDVSGSMDTDIQPHQSRLDLAKILDKRFAAKVLNLTGNRVGLVKYSQDGVFSYNLTTNKLALNNTINAYSAGGSTCIACALRAARLMLQQQSTDPKRLKFIIVMSDGIANIQANQTNLNRLIGCDVYFNIQKWKYCSRCNTTGCYIYSSSCGDNYDPVAVQNTIQDACRARTAVNATEYGIGFASNCDITNQTMQGIANCGHGKYYLGTDPNALQNIYDTIALGILNASYNAQTIKVMGNITKSYLYPDSYLYVNYTTTANVSSYGKISVTLQTPKFKTCTPKFQVSSDVQVLNSQIMSYSGIHWTDYLVLNNTKTNKAVYTLRDGSYGHKYTILGDPYIVNVPVELLDLGKNNSFTIGLGDNETKHFSCSLNDSMIYTLQVPNTGDYTNVLPNSKGCKWTIESDDGSSIVVPVPVNYTGNRTCDYKLGIYDQTNAIDASVYSLLRRLDFDKDGRVYINLNQGSLQINVMSISEAPSLWGPAVIEVRLWA